MFSFLPVGEFQELLEGAARRYRTKGDLARALGITPGRLSRVLGGEHSLDVGKCLTLAKLTGESPSRVLRVAGKGQIADAIEDLYGPGATPVSPKERELLDVWSALTQRAREGLLQTMSELPHGLDLTYSDSKGSVTLIQAKPTARKKRTVRRRGDAIKESSEETALKKRGRSG